MKVSIALEGNKKDSRVAEKLADAKFLFVVNVEELQVTDIISAMDASGEYFARMTIEYDCEAIICGVISGDIIDILAEAGVSRYLGSGETPERAVRLMNAYSLPLITGESPKKNC